MADADEEEEQQAGCISMLNGSGGEMSWLGCMVSCTSRPVDADAEDAVVKVENRSAEYLVQAELEERKGNFSSAAELYRRALRLDPGNATAHNNFGYLCSTNTNDYASAEYHYKLAIRCSPDYALAHNNLAYFLKKNKRDLEGAERHYREAIRCDADYAFAHSNLGVLLKSKKDLRGAEFHYLAAIRSNPRYAPAFLNYSLLLKNHDQAGSREYLCRAVTIDVNLRDTPAARSLARAFGIVLGGEAAAEPEHRERLASLVP